MTLSTSATFSVVVDASVLIDAILLGVERVAVRLAGAALHAPVSIDAEFLHALRRRWLTGFVDEERGRAALTMFRDVPITRHPVNVLIHRMWDLRQNVSSYDAGYVALAESLNLPLITRDARLARSSGHAARIEYIG
jgi:predicted nucleic acid-binding protein